MHNYELLLRRPKELELELELQKHRLLLLGNWAETGFCQAVDKPRHKPKMEVHSQKDHTTMIPKPRRVGSSTS